MYLNPIPTSLSYGGGGGQMSYHEKELDLYIGILPVVCAQDLSRSCPTWYIQRSSNSRVNIRQMCDRPTITSHNNQKHLTRSELYVSCTFVYDLKKKKQHGVRERIRLYVTKNSFVLLKNIIKILLRVMGSPSYIVSSMTQSGEGEKHISVPSVCW